MTADRFAVLLALAIILVALLAGCGGSGGKGQGDKPLGDGSSVQREEGK